MKSASLFSFKTLLPLAIAAGLAFSSATASAQSSGLYKPAKKGDANVEFGNQSIHGPKGKNSSNQGQVKKRRISRYYAERCLKPGPIVHCSASGKCVERAKPAVCAQAERDQQKIASIEPQETRVSPMSRTRQRRAEEDARRKVQQQVADDGKLHAGEVRLTPAGDTVAVTSAKNKQVADEAAKRENKND